MNGDLKPFERGALQIKPREFIRDAIGMGMTRRQAKLTLRHMLRDEIWMNDEYQVNVDKNPEHGFGDVEVWHLSIKRRDRSPIHDWRDLQAIKNAICGHWVEAIELYPAETRVVDTANQYHLFALIRNGDGSRPVVPCGWVAGMKTNTPGGNAVQRPIHEESEA